MLKELQEATVAQGCLHKARAAEVTWRGREVQPLQAHLS